MNTIASTLTLILGVSAVALANPTTKWVKLENCPAPVQAALTKAATGAKIEKIREVSREGQIHFQGHLDLADDRDQVLHLNADGTVVKTVTEIQLKNVPEVVRASLTKLAEGVGKLDDVEEIVEGTTTTWQAEIDREKLPDVKVLVDNAGKEISREEESP